MASILSPPNENPKPKTYVSKGLLPPFIDPTQPPTKTPPWRQINSTLFISSLTITLPSSFHTTLWPHLTTSTSSTPTHQPRYAKVLLTLPSILSDPFFTRYIKTGNILLLSDGIPGASDWICTLRDGILRVEMAREVYERCGMQGKPGDRNGGARKHGRDWWTVEVDLRAAAMVRGRKGFERLVRAAREVLGQGRLWLFRDLGWSGKGGGEGEGRDDGVDDEVITKFHPTVVDVEPEVVEVRNVLVPSVMAHVEDDTDLSSSLDFHNDHYEIVEWLDLVRLSSSRITKHDNSDPYICQYSVPSEETATSTDLRTVTWTGLLDRSWCTQLLISMIRASRKLKTAHWLALTITSHRTEALGQKDGCTIILRPTEPTSSSVKAETRDVSMDDLPPSTSDATENNGNSRDGLQHYTCFEFVDTVIQT